MDFDQNQKIGHFGKVTPPQRGRIPEIPIAVCFGAENPLIFRRKIASKCQNFPENDPCLRVWVHILRKFKSLKFCPFFHIDPTVDWVELKNANMEAFGAQKRTPNSPPLFAPFLDIWPPGPPYLALGLEKDSGDCTTVATQPGNCTTPTIFQKKRKKRKKTLVTFLCA